jgi:hypothetical protein
MRISPQERELNLYQMIVGVLLLRVSDSPSIPISRISNLESKHKTVLSFYNHPIDALAEMGWSKTLNLIDGDM